jgi:RNA polymerase sigma-70 factor (ECF subfamily)
MIGTPCYMSPEQAMGLRAIDRRTDLWAVGAVAFECLTGVRAFQAASLGALVAKILTGPIPVPSLAAPEAALPPAVDAWMARVLVRDRTQRLASAEEVAATFAASVAVDDVEDVEDEGASPIAERRDESTIRDPWQAGDMGAAVRSAIELLGPEILHYLSSVLGDRDLADDAFAVFCEHLWTALPRFEWRSSARTWAYAIARRAAADVQRATRRGQRRSEPLTESRVAAIAEQVRSATWPLLQTARRSALLQLRDELAPEDRMLLVLRVDRELAWQDVARVFLEDEAPSALELSRASARLRKRFQLVRERLRELARAKGLAGEAADEG